MRTSTYLLAASAALLIMGASCNSARNSAQTAQPASSLLPPGAVRLEFSELAASAYGGIDSPSVQVFSQPSDFERFWQQLHAGREPMPPMPEADFSRHLVVGYFAGMKPSGGYRVRITRIEQQAGALAVYAELAEPGPNCFVTEALTQPYQLVRVEWSGGAPARMLHALTRVTSDC
jgi:hypothetical protein